MKKQLSKILLNNVKLLTLNNPIKEETIQIRKKYNTKLPDSIIIASALYLDFPLITADNDFKKVEELSLIHYEIETGQ